MLLSMTEEAEITPGSPSALDAQARIDHEISELTSTIDELYAQIESHRTQIESLRSQIQSHHTRIKSLDTQIRSLRTQRNRLSSVSRLPPEVLSAIFIHWARIHHDSMLEQLEIDDVGFMTDGTESTNGGTQSGTEDTDSLSDGVEERMHGVPEWVNASHVCRHWRDVALDSPILWSYISTASKPWINEMFSRSRTAPLRIRFEWMGIESYPGCILRKLFAHTDRIQELRLDFPGRDVANVFPQFSSPAPLLQSLEIHANTGSISGPYDESYIMTLFDGLTPALRRLELDRCFISRTASMPASLTTIILSHLDRPIAPTPAELQVMLTSTPNLMHLELNRALAPSPSKVDGQVSDGWGNIRLPHLLRLAMHEPLPKLVRFLPFLDVPLRTEVRINTFRGCCKEWMSFRSFLVQKFFTSNLCIRNLAVDAKTAITFVFSASETHHHHLCSPDWNCNIPLKIQINSIGFNSHDLIREIIQDAYHSGFLAGLQSTRVTLGGHQAWNQCSTFLEDVFGLLPELRYIQLIDASDTLGCLFTFLSLAPHERDPKTSLAKSSDPVFAPALEQLVISGSKFDQGVSQYYQHGVSITNLYRALSVRKEKGLSPIRLSLVECRGVFKEDVVKLKDVAEVVWDGIEESDSEGSSYSPDTSEGEESTDGEESDDSTGNGDSQVHN